MVGVSPVHPDLEDANGRALRQMMEAAQICAFSTFSADVQPTCFSGRNLECGGRINYIAGQLQNAKFSDTRVNADVNLTDSHTVDHQLVWAKLCVPALSSSSLTDTSKRRTLPCISKTLASDVTQQQLFQDRLVKHTCVPPGASPLLDVNEIHIRVTDFVREGRSLFFVDKAT